MKAFKDIFLFEYQGGGYFREKGIAQGKKAEILHGEEAVKFIYDEMMKQMDELNGSPVTFHQEEWHEQNPISIKQGVVSVSGETVKTAKEIALAWILLRLYAMTIHLRKKVQELETKVLTNK